MSELPSLSLDDRVLTAIAAGAVVDFSLSGGKDSTAAAIAVSQWLDAIGHPRHLRSATHANLGLIEWPETIDHIERLTEHLGLPLAITAKPRGLIERWKHRFDAAKARYANLETYFLVGPFSSASLRFCTSEQKTGTIRPSLGRRHPAQTIVSVIGLRAEESPRRALTPISKIDQNPGSHSTRPTIIAWHPIRDWTTAEVLDLHARHSFPLHYAYTRHNMTRLSCAYCVLASRRDLANAVASHRNAAALAEITELEITSGFSFQPSAWLADLAPPGFLSPHTLAAAKRAAQTRRALEATLPADLRYNKGWPPRVPSFEEAQTIAHVRAQVLEQHDLTAHYTTPATIISRFQELHHTRAPMPA